MFTTTHAHILYALATAVPAHARAASNSVAVRSACLAQVIKVQRAVLADTPAPKLYDKNDGEDDSIWMYVRSTACVRGALQAILNGWLHSGYGSRFAATEEGGMELIQFCVKHILNAYNGQTKLKRAMGNPWETAMIQLGPTQLIVHLFLMVCGAEQNLRVLNKVGGEKAVHNLSRYGDENKVRQQSTILLTKLAVLNAPGINIPK